MEQTHLLRILWVLGKFNSQQSVGARMQQQRSDRFRLSGYCTRARQSLPSISCLVSSESPPFCFTSMAVKIENRERGTDGSEHIVTQRESESYIAARGRVERKTGSEAFLVEISSVRLCGGREIEPRGGICAGRTHLPSSIFLIIIYARSVLLQAAAFIVQSERNFERVRKYMCTRFFPEILTCRIAVLF